jgi:phosphoglycolate phosphatase
MKTAVFFDWDGTLVDSLGILITAHNYVREAHGLPLWSEEEFFGAVTYSSRELYPQIYGDKSDAAQAMLYEFIHKNHLNYLKTMEGSEELLDMLMQMGIPMAVISNKRNDILVREVEALGWQRYFEVYIGAGVAEKDKPSAAPLLYALNHHPAKPALEDLIYVGDTETDLRTCADAKCPCVYIKQEGRSEALIETYNPLLVVNHVVELREKLIAHIQR